MRSAQDYEDSWLKIATQCRGLEQFDVQLGIKSKGYHMWKNLVWGSYSGGGEEKFPLKHQSPKIFPIFTSSSVA
jgi:hypothetical protein